MKHSFRATLVALWPASDELAMERVREEDDAHAFAQLVRRWESPIQRLCSRMVGDVYRGEDLAQEVFARLFAKRKEYQARGRFSTFLWRMALNLCYDELRRARRRPETPLELTDEDNQFQASNEPGAAEILSRREEGELVRQAVLHLPDIYRAVVVLRHYENLKFREIADVLGIPKGTVKSRLAEALNQLHRRLRPTLQASGSPTPEPKPIAASFLL